MRKVLIALALGSAALATVPAAAQPPEPVPTIQEAQLRCAKPYQVVSGDRCIWSCAEGTQPDRATNECVCKRGLSATGTDKLGRRVCGPQGGGSEAVMEGKPFVPPEGIKMQSGTSAPDPYQALIAPDNHCTELVRRMCGEQNQCSTSAGCQAGTALLNHYNEQSGEAQEQVALQCISAYQDHIIFNPCDA